jgi:hypothetical protein
MGGKVKEEIDFSREKDLEIAEHFLKLKLPSHEHDLSRGSLRCVQCNACGCLLPENTQTCRCGAQLALKACINPRIPLYMRSFKDAWKDVFMKMKTECNDISLFWTKTDGWGVEVDGEIKAYSETPEEAICLTALKMTDLTA